MVNVGPGGGGTPNPGGGNKPPRRRRRIPRPRRRQPPPKQAAEQRRAQVERPAAAQPDQVTGPAGYPNDPAYWSTGDPNSAGPETYHFHREETFHTQYASTVGGNGTGAEANPA